MSVPRSAHLVVPAALFATFVAFGCGEMLIEQPTDPAPATVATGSGGTVAPPTASPPPEDTGGGPRFTVRGTARGITAPIELKLASESGGIEDHISVNMDGPFAFEKTLPVGAAYTVSLVTPDGAAPACALKEPLPDGGVSSGEPSVAGSAGGDASDVTLQCGLKSTYTVSAHVTGLADGGTFQVFNQGAIVTYTHNGTFPFPQNFPNGWTWFINFMSQPAGQTCTANPHIGTIDDADVVSEIVCTP